MGRVTVLGAGGGIGRALVSELVTRGHDVTAVTRDGRDVGVEPSRPVAADLLDTGGTVAACGGADVVVLSAQRGYRTWPAELPTLVDNALAGAAAAGARLVMVDNLYAYGAPVGPITEASPEIATTRKGRLRAELGRRLLIAHREGRASVAIGRLSDVYGADATNTMVHALGVSRARKGRAPQAMIDADQPHTFVYVADAARGLARLVERPDADGRVWILPAAPAVTQRQLLTLVAREAGLSDRIGRVSPAMLLLAGLLSPRIRELRELTGQWDRPYVTDATRFVEHLGAVRTTPHEDAVAEMMAARP